TTGDEPFFNFVQRHAELWKLGQKGKDNGCLIAIAVNDHEFRIHPGRGLEGIMPDSWCGSLSRDVGRPQFQAGQFGKGVFDVTVAVANRIADDAGVKLTGIPDQRHVEQSTDPAVVFVTLALILIVSFFIFRANWRYQRSHGGRSRGSNWTGGFGGFGGSSWGGGSFSGGSWGGGSGGGSFGGGGTFSGGGGGTKW
ncbi:MAG TPA: TPM domain-containing protein, partial [Pirellulales bacterium]|nr:TPM domain-containing protein [Pirellulales bacterium]